MPADTTYTRPNQSAWLTYIRNRNKKKKNILGFIGGSTGSGKTYCGLYVCEEIDPDFTIQNVCFNPSDFMKLIDEGIDGKPLKSGTCILFEEVGVAMSSRNWYATVNKMLNYMLQTFRHRVINVFFTSPYMDFVDSNTRKLFHVEITTTGQIDYEANTNIVKPMLIQYNSRYNKFYYKYLKVLTPNGTLKVKRWRVPLASRELRVAYESRKRTYTDELNREIRRAIDKKGTTEAQKVKYLWKCNSCGNQREYRTRHPQKCHFCSKLLYKWGDFLENDGLKNNKVEGRV